jgi:hypothetical protein
MANDEHVALLKQGVGAWNAWRNENPDIRPSLDEADLGGAEPSAADLSEADLEEANLNEAEPQRGEPQRGEPSGFHSARCGP